MGALEGRRVEDDELTAMALFQALAAGLERVEFRLEGFEGRHRLLRDETWSAVRIIARGVAGNKGTRRPRAPSIQTTSRRPLATPSCLTLEPPTRDQTGGRFSITGDGRDRARLAPVPSGGPESPVSGESGAPRYPRATPNRGAQREGSVAPLSGVVRRGPAQPTEPLSVNTGETRDGGKPRPQRRTGVPHRRRRTRWRTARHRGRGPGDGGTVMDMETRQFWADAARRILGHEISFAGPKGKATCHCAGASAATGLRWCKAEWPRRHIRLCTGVGGGCRIVRASSLTETDRASIVTGPDEDSEVAKAGLDGIRKPPAIYLVQKDGDLIDIYSSTAKAVSVLPEGKRRMAIESLLSTGRWTERGENVVHGLSIEKRRLK